MQEKLAWNSIFGTDFGPEATFCLKHHVIGDAPVEQVVSYLEAQYGMRAHEVNERDTVHYEPGGYGSYAMYQPKETFTIHGRRLTTESTNAEQVLLELQNSEPKEGLYTLKQARMICLVLTEAERNTFRDSIVRRLPEIRERANEFLKKHNEAWVNDPERKKHIIIPQDIQPPRVSN